MRGGAVCFHVRTVSSQHLSIRINGLSGYMHKPYLSKFSGHLGLYCGSPGSAAMRELKVLDVHCELVHIEGKPGKYVPCRLSSTNLLLGLVERRHREAVNPGPSRSFEIS